MYVIEPPDGLAGLTFQSALVRINTRENSILLGVVEDSKVLMCPPNDHMITPETRLVVLRGYASSPNKSLAFRNANPDESVYTIVGVCIAIGL